MTVATLRDIAALANVSTATVSHVVNGKVYVSSKLRERVLSAIRELNYQPNAVARSLRTRQSHTVGMIIPDISNPFFPAVVRGAEDVLMRAGYAVIVGNSDNDARKEETYYRRFLERQVDGLLAVATTDKPSNILKQLILQHTPVVYVDREYASMPGDIVVADNLRGSNAAVRHLIDTGHTRVAIITGPLHLANARVRLKGYQHALIQEGLPKTKELIREGAFDIESGFKETSILLSVRPRADAIFVCNAQMAVGALRALSEAHIAIPGEIALVCFDQLDFFDLLNPRLTCVAAPAYELGAVGAQLLLDRIAGRLTGPWVREVLPAALVLRESSGLRSRAQRADRYPQPNRNDRRKRE
jgi:DNA-binding LacI/PurR family transcriptional regulator